MKPTIGIDSRSLRQGPAGIATYVQNLLEQLPQLDPLAGTFPPSNVLWNQLRVPLAQRRRRWSLYHAPAYTAPLRIGCPVVLSVHDISYFVDVDWYPNRIDSLRRAYYRASMFRAARIVVPSRFSATEIERLFPALSARLRVIPLAVSRFFSVDPGLAAQVRARLGLPDRFLLHVGDLHLRRGIDLIQAVGTRLNLPVVLVGKLLDSRIRIGPGAVRLEDLTSAELKGVYNAAAAFVYPSVYEGFGLPLLEAMACGVPVVASRRASIPDVCGDAAQLVEPELEALVDGVSLVLGDPERFRARGLARAASCSWEMTARRTAEVYREVLGSHQPESAGFLTS